MSGENEKALGIDLKGLTIKSEKFKQGSFIMKCMLLSGL